MNDEGEQVAIIANPLVGGDSLPYFPRKALPPDPWPDWPEVAPEEVDFPSLPAAAVAFLSAAAWARAAKP